MSSLGNEDQKSNTSDVDNKADLIFESSEIKNADHSDLFVNVQGEEARIRAEQREQAAHDKELERHRKEFQSNLENQKKEIIRNEKKKARKEKYRASFIYRHFIKGWHILIPICTVLAICGMSFGVVKYIDWRNEQSISREKTLEHVANAANRDEVYNKAVEILNSEDGDYNQAIVYFDDAIAASEGENRELIKIAKANFIYEFSRSSTNAIIETLDDVDKSFLNNEDLPGYYISYIDIYEHLGDSEKVEEYRSLLHDLEVENEEMGPPAGCDEEKLLETGNC